MSNNRPPVPTAPAALVPIIGEQPTVTGHYVEILARCPCGSGAPVIVAISRVPHECPSCGQLWFIARVAFDATDPMNWNVEVKFGVATRHPNDEIPSGVLAM